MTRAESTDLLDAADTPFELRVLEVALDVVRRDVATACDPVLDTAPLQAQREVPHVSRKGMGRSFATRPCRC